VIENVTGANGSIGVGRAARSINDGYTIAFGSWSNFIANGVAYTLPYNLLTDFEPIVLLTTHPHVIVAKKIMPADDLKGLIAWLKANPDKATAGTNGVGSPQHVAAIFFQNKTDTRFGFVPYRGGAPAFQGLLAGQIDLIFAPTGEAAALIRGRSIKAYAVMAQNRIAAAPDLSTWMKGECPGFICQPGSDCGRLRTNTLPPSLTPRPLNSLPTRRYARGWLPLTRRFSRLTSRRLRRSAPSTRPKLRNGGPS
jgi:tripartite-type tricarboxylate transporter receptor subunit TctC